MKTQEPPPMNFIKLIKNGQPWRILSLLDFKNRESFGYPGKSDYNFPS